MSLTIEDGFLKGQPHPVHGCACRECRKSWPDDPENPFQHAVMVLCDTCGNKRCPHATNHALACTHSNDPGQPGSAYE